MNTLYRIHTEATSPVQVDNIARAIRVHFDSFNVLLGTGHWQGAQERSATAEIYASASDANIVRAIAQRIRKLNGQDAVLVASVAVSCELLTA